MRRAAKKDTTHLPIVDFLELHGIIVSDVSGLAGLGYDIVAYDRQTEKIVLMELKSNKAVHHKSAATRLRPSQIRAIALLPIQIVETAEQALGCFR